MNVKKGKVSVKSYPWCSGPWDIGVLKRMFYVKFVDDDGIWAIQVPEGETWFRDDVIKEAVRLRDERQG